MSGQIRTRLIKRNDGMIIPVMHNIEKADVSLKEEYTNTVTDYQLVSPVTPPKILKGIAEESTIIPQCIRAYKTNICGFGIKAVPVDENAEDAQAEVEKLQDILDNMNYDMPIKDVFQNIIDSKEQMGIAYLEVIRNNVGEVVELNYLDTEFIEQTSQGPIEVFKTTIRGKEIERRKRFRKFKQRVNSSDVWFKEFGFPKFMNYQTGQITDTDNGEYEANEILTFRSGRGVYPPPRWWGQLMNVQGSKMAEFVNYNYFLEGRHTPVMIIVRGGTLSEKSWSDLQEYMNGIKGYKNSHGFIVLEVEEIKEGIQSLSLDDGKGNKVDVEIKDLSPMLQNDALFTEYLKGNESGVQSSFNLPDIYVGKTKEYNRATAYAAMEVTEKQVFQPERNSLAWVINNILLAGYGFTKAKVEVVAPKFSNVDDLFKILTVCEKAGGITPMLAQELIRKYTADVEIEKFEDAWAEVPVQVLKILQSGQMVQGQDIQKSQRVVDVLKDVKDVLGDLDRKING